MITGCARCYYLPECGGLEGNQELFGCHHHSREVCAKHGWTCPWCRPRQFTRRWAEVGGWPPVAANQLLAMEGKLPPYIPKLDHWSSRTGRLKVPIIALPTHKIFGARGGGYRVRWGTHRELATRWKVPPSTRIILVSVKEDAWLEKFWRYHHENELASHLANLGISGITIHNFSYFSDAPRPHTMFNQARMARCIERLSAAGVPVIPHLNALTSADWTHWHRLLQSFPTVRYVCKEFQTHDDETGELERLAKLQDEIGRPLHPILIAAMRYTRRLQELFDQFTIIDSLPFSRTIHRRSARLDGDSVKWDAVDARNGRELHRLLVHNVRIYDEFARGRIVRKKNSRQVDWLEVLGRAVVAGHSMTADPAGDQRGRQEILFGSSNSRPDAQDP